MGGGTRRESQSEPGGSQKTIFISCSALIRETKLCVGGEHQAELDSLLSRLAAREIQAEAAVKQLMAIVGSTIVKQAGLSAINLQKGILPHGWIEYIDDATRRPYYYNVHTKETTWYKPEAPDAPPPLPSEPLADEDGVDTSVFTNHRISLSGEI